VRLVEIVVPCFNEAARLDERAFLDLAGVDGVVVRFVDDGSTDGTAAVLRRLREASDSVEVTELSENRGKAEAVRLGLLDAAASGVDLVGYLDADLSTSGAEFLAMVAILRERDDLAAVIGSRVARLGSRIDRSPLRHYSGRVFASAASVALGVAVYDTQCGAKVFRADDHLAAAIGTPFRSPWSFDVFLLQRLLVGTSERPGLPISAFLEVPLTEWHDKPGSKVKPVAGLMALVDVLRLAWDRRARRAAGGADGP